MKPANTSNSISRGKNNKGWQANNGFVVLHRKFLSWEWYQNSSMVHLFIHLLLKANHADGNWQGHEIKRGQLMTGLNKLSHETGIKIPTIRTNLNKLKSTNEITIHSTNRFSLITLVKYDFYQCYVNTSTRQLTNGTHSINKQGATNNNNITINNKDGEHTPFYKNEIEANKESTEWIKAYIDFVDFLHGKNDIKAPAAHILKVPRQLSFEEFVKIHNQCTSSGIELKDLFNSMLNTPDYTKRITSLFLTLKNWIRRLKKQPAYAQQ